MLEGTIASGPETEPERCDGELQADEPGNATTEEALLVGLRKLHDPFHVEGDRLPEEPEYLFERAPLYREIQIEADGLPFIISSEGVAV